MDRTQLDALEAALSQSEDYEGSKVDVADAVKDAFIAEKLSVPADSEVHRHFLSKVCYRNDIQPTPGQSVSLLEEAFYERCGLGMYHTFCNKTTEATEQFGLANGLSATLGNPFTTSQNSFLSGLNGTSLQNKLHCERFYERINRLLREKNATEAIASIGAGLELAQAGSDQKREHDLLGKCLYLFYESFDPKLHHVGLSLCRYMDSLLPEYETGKLWVAFHEGNIRMDLGNLALPGDPEGSEAHFRKAREVYESGLDFALKQGFSYAIMTMYERLGMTNNRLKRYNLAIQNYEESLKIGEEEDVNPWLVSKNEVRCFIGLGNVAFDSRTTATADACYLAADQYYRKAAAAANQVNYPANEKVAYNSLKRLCEAQGLTTEAAHYEALADAL